MHSRRQVLSMFGGAIGAVPLAKAVQADNAPLRTHIDELNGFINGLDDRRSRIRGLETGLNDLDEMLDGLQKGHLYLIAARPGMGKTSLALRITEHVSLNGGKPSLYVSLEIPAPNLTRVMVCAHCHVNVLHLLKGMIKENDREKLATTGRKFADAPILIDDAIVMSIDELRLKARQAKADRGVELIVVDPVQSLWAPDISKWSVEIVHCIRELKAMALDLDVPVVALTGISHRVRKREDGMPRITDLCHSKPFYENIDSMMLLCRSEHRGDDPDTRNLMNLVIPKNCTGPTGIIQLTYLREFMRFEPFSWVAANRAKQVGGL